MNKESNMKKRYKFMQVGMCLAATMMLTTTGCGKNTEQNIFYFEKETKIQTANITSGGTIRCPKDNLFGLEQVTIDESNVILGFNQKICDDSYLNLDYAIESGREHSCAHFTNLSGYLSQNLLIEKKMQTYIVTIPLVYDENRICNTDEPVVLTGVSFCDAEIQFAENSMIISYDLWGGECCDTFIQTYEFSSGTWSEVSSEMTLYPLTDSE